MLPSSSCRRQRRRRSSRQPRRFPGLVGTWQNTDAATRSIVRVVLTDQQGALGVHVYGACSPTPCDWQQVPGQVYDASVSGGAAVAFTATYSFGFKNTIIAGHHQGPNLVIEDFNAFTDGSGRAPYYDKRYLQEGRHPAPIVAPDGENKAVSSGKAVGELAVGPAPDEPRPTPQNRTRAQNGSTIAMPRFWDRRRTVSVTSGARLPISHVASAESRDGINEWKRLSLHFRPGRDLAGTGWRKAVLKVSIGRCA